MNTNKLFLSLVLTALVSVVGGVNRAQAVENPTTCENDIDCVATPTCGGDVCDWGSQPPKCKAAGGASKGEDGWCNPAHGDDDCKCKALGAKCVGVYCTFTKPSDAPSSGGAGTGGGTAGTTGAAGTGTTGAAGTGTTGAAGTSTSTGSSGGGCAVASSSAGGLGALIGLGLVAGGLIRRRRRA